ncbi:MAG: sigma-54-dependent Fis family transcriptional regulator [Myxococcales bacterium]|nr:sigma-54-dependent Fis family transcriptional regulator [Myxococcales bacterium]
MATVLVIDDNDTVRDGVATVLHRMGHRALAASSGQQGIDVYRGDDEQIDLVITDLKMEPVDGMSVLRAVIDANPAAVVMMITAHGTVKTAVEAMQAGAFDFIEKPFPVELLKSKVEKALAVLSDRTRAARLERENEYLRDELGQTGGAAFAEMIGSSEPMRRVFRLVEKVARTDSTVHIHGESGTGKELVANAIHALSPRASGPFVKINCGAIPETLLESELFGHEKGAFTDAAKRRIGRFELAHGGTIFLDEIGDVSLAMQVKLLRVLQERTFERVGGERTVAVDVRVVTATNKNLEAEVAAGRFREDLLYRLRIIPIDLPPLRDRRDDVPALVAHFVEKLAKRTRSLATGFSDEALAALQCYAWPGNVRELENVVEQSLVFADGPLVRIDDLPATVLGVERADDLQLPDGERALPDILEELERQLILRAYEKAGGVKTETARLLGIKTPALYYKLEKYGIGDVRSRTSDS